MKLSTSRTDIQSIPTALQCRLHLIAVGVARKETIAVGGVPANTGKVRTCFVRSDEVPIPVAHIALGGVSVPCPHSAMTRTGRADFFVGFGGVHIPLVCLSDIWIYPPTSHLTVPLLVRSVDAYLFGGKPATPLSCH